MRSIKDSTFITIPGTGHLCYQEDSITFNAIVLDFLTSLYPLIKKGYLSLHKL